MQDIETFEVTVDGHTYIVYNYEPRPIDLDALDLILANVSVTNEEVDAALEDETPFTPQEWFALLNR